MLGHRARLLSNGNRRGERRYYLKPAPVGGVWDNARRNQPVPDEQDDQRANDGADKSGTLIWPIPADRLPDERGEKCAADAKERGEDTAGLFGPGAKKRATMRRQNR